MFSGIPFSKKYSPFGDHQRIDRLAYTYLKKRLDLSRFPSVQSILDFEGRNGPDGAKYMGEGEEHFYDPQTDGAELLVLIHECYDELVASIAAGNTFKAARAASWLAHAIVDGLTPAHHFPYHETVNELMADTEHVRDSIGKHFYIKGETMPSSIKKTWRLTGPQGVLTSHTLFETSMALSLQQFRPRLNLSLPPKESIDDIFRERARLVNTLGLYDKFIRRGPNPSMSLKIRRVVGPAMVEAVALIWARAIEEAKK